MNAKPNFSPREMLDFVKARGYSAEPVTNCQAAVDQGAPLTIMGYELRGPRGNKGVIIKDPDGLYSREHVELWCDSVDYATAKIANRRARTV